nr:ribonuclease H-like domain-containing protein [Tanacetum cinerariifolium]
LVLKVVLLCLTKRTMYHGRLVFSGDANHDITVTETFHLQTDDELSDKELKQIEADDQAIQTILLGLPEDIYAAVDSCETAQEIWLRVQQMMKGSDIGIQEKKANQNGVDMLPLFIGPRICIQLITLNYITDPTTAMNMVLVLMAKAFKLNYSTPTNNNQRISSNPRNKQIAQPGNSAGYNDIIRNQVIQNAVQNPRVQNVGNQNDLIGVQGNGNQIGNGNLVAARAEGNAAGQNRNQISAPVYDSDGSAEYTELLEPIPESHKVPQHDNDVISEDTNVEQGGETVEQHPANFEETHALYESLYQNLAIEVEK